jgi:hypothetical protein
MEHSLNSNIIGEDDCNDKGTEETRLFFVFIPHKRDLYIGPKRVFSRHDGDDDASSSSRTKETCTRR